uniref:Condensin-2 complex subunit G2 n=1 Tax=Cajanus cajan TaxID=3821 RepID=A0A151SCA8_CAJCA|nr:Condensin-2 complex subunit G2 [Cajanus cajan]
MEKGLRSSLLSSAQEFISLATKQSLKSSKSSLKTLIHNIKPSSPLCSSLPSTLSDSISAAVRSFQNLLEPNAATNLGSPRTPPSKRPRRSSRRSEPEPVDDRHELLARLEILTHLALLCASHPRKPFSLADLLPGVQALHDSLIVFEAETALSSAIEGLCEEWWKENLAGRETLISQSLPFLLSRSLTLKRKVDVHRVCVLREAFALFDFDDESIEDLKLLLVRCVISPLYLKTEDGRRFLSFVFGLSDQLGKEILAMIRSQIPFGRKSMLEAYGDILFRAWKAVQGDSRSHIENGFLQDLIEAAIHAGSGAFASYIRRVLGAFINQRTTDGVEKMLYRLAEPVIFRSLQAANSNVRQNALHLLLDMFPLEDPDATKEEKDTLLDKQFFLLEKLLTDDCPEVRMIAVEGSCRVLHLFWEVIPSPIITKMITKVIGDMSHDVCNEVRLSTLNGIIYLLGNPHSHEILKVLLTRLRHLMLDKVLTVRVAAVDLLLHLKDVRNFQFNKVVELDLLLSALASDQPPVAQKITKLLLPSYFPSKIPIEEACNRCITLVKRAPMAGARFCQFAILEGAAKSHLMELVKVFLSLILSPDKLDANQIEGFLVATSYVCENLACEPCYINALRELLDGEKVRGLLTVASKGQAQSSLFNIVSTVCPDDNILELTIEHVLSCLEKLFGADDIMKNHDTDSYCGLKLYVCTEHKKELENNKNQSNSLNYSLCIPFPLALIASHSFPAAELVIISYFPPSFNISHDFTHWNIRLKFEFLFIFWFIYDEAKQVFCMVKMLTAVLKFMADTTAMCFAPHNHGLFLNYTSKSVQHIVSLLDKLYHSQIQFKDEDKRNIIFCLKSSFTYAAKILNQILTETSGSSITPPKTFTLANNLLDLIIAIESCMGSSYALRLVATAKPWLPDVLLALGSTSILKHTDCGEEHSTASEQMKLHFPRWPLIIAKTELCNVNEAEEDDECSLPEKFSAFNKLLAMLIILLKKNPSIMDAVGVIFMISSLVGLEKKDFGLALGLLRFVCFKLFKHDDKDWGDMMLSSLQEIFPKIEREIAEEDDEDELWKLTCTKELIEPLWMYHLYETGKVSLADD